MLSARRRTRSAASRITPPATVRHAELSAAPVAIIRAANASPTDDHPHSDTIVSVPPSPGVGSRPRHAAGTRSYPARSHACITAASTVTAPSAAKIQGATGTADCIDSPAMIAIEYDSHAPSTKMSECAKLMNFRIPYTIVYPSAINAYRLPTARPSIRV